MIEVFTLRNAHLFGDALPSQAKLRYKVFVADRGLDHRFFEDMEYDEFDTPAAVYFVWRDDDGAVRGLLRLLPTTLPYMLQSYWPFALANEAPPVSRHVFEVTRLCVDKTCGHPARLTIMPQLLLAVQEYCAAQDITHVIGITRPHLISHFIRSGIEWLGPEHRIEGEMEQAFRVAFPHMRPAYHCQKYGITGPVLSITPRDLRRIAA